MSSKQNHATLLYGFPRNTEVTEKPVDIEAALTRVHTPLNAVRCNLELYGMYALPDTWKEKVNEGEDGYQYAADVLGMAISEGKAVPKELTEEEKAAAEEAGKAGAKGGKPPAKGAKVEEPSAEELERQEQARLEREERERKLAEEWEQLDAETKHIRQHEDIFKEPCVKICNSIVIDRVEKLQAELGEVPEDDQEKRDNLQDEIDELMGNTNVGMANCAKTGYELIELEESVRYDHGTWIRFMRTPAAAPEADAKGKPPAKGKGAAPTEELKPVYGKGWISFDDLNRPGCTQITQRVFLQTCPPMMKKTNEDGTEEEVEETEYDRVFEDAKSYVHLKISMDQPIVALGSDKPEPQPSEIVPVK
jgi:hypothetical protein